jgi:hypothetical protein
LVRRKDFLATLVMITLPKSHTYDAMLILPMSN